MTYEIPKPPPPVTDVLREAQAVLGEHLARIEAARAPVVADNIVEAIDLAKKIIQTRAGATPT